MFWIRLWFKVILHRKIKCIPLFCICIFRRCYIKYGVLRISQNSQESICVRVSFFNNVAGLRTATLLKTEIWHRCFPVNFAKFKKRTPFLQNISGPLLLQGCGIVCVLIVLQVITFTAWVNLFPVVALLCSFCSCTFFGCLHPNGKGVAFGKQIIIVFWNSFPRNYQY